MTDPNRPDSDQPWSAPTPAADLPAPAVEPADAPAPSSADDTPTVAYTPPASTRPEWASPAPSAATVDQPGRWGTPVHEPAASSAPVATAPVVPGNGNGHGARRAGPGSIVAASALSAILAAGGTVLALKGAGALDPAAATSGNNSTASTAASRQPISIDESSAIIDAASKAGPSVVRMIVSGTTTDQFGGSIPEQGVGSGIIFDAAGWILTNRHVVTNTSGQLVSSITVELKDGRTFQGDVYGVDTLTDLAIVKIHDAPSDLTAATIGSSSDLEVGQLAIAIGSPLGTYSNSVTSGIVSATGRTVTVDSGDTLNNLIQTDAAINHGNSGGPLLDAAGDVIGINTAVASDATGIGFAIPIDLARPIMQQALAGQELSRPYIGVRYKAVDRQVQDEEKLSVDHGALVADAQQNGQTLPAVVPNGPAAKAGVQKGDIIVAINDQTIDSEHPLDLILAGFAPKQSVQLEIIRGSDTIHVTVTLGTRPPDL